MNYIHFENDFIFDTEKNGKYILSKENGICKVGCNDEKLAEFLKDLGYDWGFALGLSVKILGDDGFLYEVSPDLKVKKCEKFGSKNIDNMIRYKLKAEKSVSRDNKYKTKILSTAETDSGIIEKHNITGFDRCVYFSKKSDCVIPFRLKKAKQKGSPVLIYFHGAGSMGRDNFKNLFEYKQMVLGLKIPDCNVIIPQSPYFANHSPEMIRKYMNSCTKMIGEVIEKTGGDKSRVYAFGVSFGGCCVWEMLTDYSEVLAGAVPTMGKALNYKDIDFEKLKSFPLWIVHASDDTNVEITLDDWCWDKLKNINPNVKYSRYDKYGHKVMTKFFRSEPWVEWLFGQSK